MQSDKLILISKTDNHELWFMDSKNNNNESIISCNLLLPNAIQQMELCVASSLYIYMYNKYIESLLPINHKGVIKRPYGVEILI